MPDEGDRARGERALADLARRYAPRLLDESVDPHKRGDGHGRGGRRLQAPRPDAASAARHDVLDALMWLAGTDPVVPARTADVAPSCRVEWSTRDSLLDG
jgi:hypothetical protein